MSANTPKVNAVTRKIEALKTSIVHRLNGTPVTIKKLSGDMFTAGNTHELWGVLSQAIADNKSGSRTADQLRVQIQAVADDYADDPTAADFVAELNALLVAQPEEPEFVGLGSGNDGYGDRTPITRDYVWAHAPHDTLMAKVEPHLAEAGIYRRGGKLVRVRTTRKPQSLIKNATVNGPTIDVYDKPAKLGLDLTRVIVFEELKGPPDDRKLVPVPANSHDMNALLNFADWPTTPILEGITSGPFIRPDGTICDKRGYDPETGWYLDTSIDPLNVPANPTLSDVQKSVAMLLELVSEFEWSVPDGHAGGVTPSQAGWLGYLLTLLARPAIDGPVPAFVFNATSKGSGKTTLAEVANVIAYGFKPSVTEMPQGKNGDEEIRKMMFSFAVAGSQSILIDNWTSGGRVGGTTLDYYATATTVVNRLLGVIKNETCPWRAVLSIGGNALSVMSDFADRCVWLSLTPTVANPRERVPAGGWKFPELVKHVADNREKYLRCALTILRAHHVSNLPKPAGARNWGTFDNWAKIVRNAVMNATGVDLKANLDAAEVEDAEIAEMSTLVAGLAEFQEFFGAEKWWGAGDVYRTVKEANQRALTPTTGQFQTLNMAMDFDVTARAFNRSGANKISRYVDRICDGFKISKKRNTDAGSWLYRLTRVAPPTPPAPPAGSVDYDQ